jgi:NADH-quinone oxidoreductase subunit N
VGLLFKVAVFPFHSWVPDVYQGASTPVTAFMATGVKLVSFVAFLRFVGTDALTADRGETLIQLLEWLAVLTMLVGNLAAIVQNNIKRVLAYSGVAHSGYAMVGVIAAGMGSQGLLGASGVVYYLIAYSVMTLGAFGVVSLLEKREDSLIQVDDLQGLGRRCPWLAALLSLFLLSLAGIPPTVGFFGKFFIFSAAIQQELYWLAIWGVLNSVISVYYYLRPIVVMYMRDEGELKPVHSRPMTQATIVALAVLVVVLGLVPSPIFEMVSSSLSGMF